jgi:exosome complex RNA-binding protein Rrp42 (RNase PH superfamily)
VSRCRSSDSQSRIRLACLTGALRLHFVLPRLIQGLLAFPHRTTILADPTAFEEPLLDTSISIVLDECGALLSVNQLGIADKDTMSTCVASAKERHEARGREIYFF